jgi:hypothetical protein
VNEGGREGEQPHKCQEYGEACDDFSVDEARVRHGVGVLGGMEVLSSDTGDNGSKGQFREAEDEAQETVERHFVWRVGLLCAGKSLVLGLLNLQVRVLLGESEEMLKGRGHVVRYLFTEDRQPVKSHNKITPNIPAQENHRTAQATNHAPPSSHRGEGANTKNTL